MKKYKILSIISIFLFFIISLLVIIPTIGESKWITIYYQFKNNHSNNNNSSSKNNNNNNIIDETIVIEYSLRNLIINKAIINYDDSVNSIYLNRTSYPLPFTCSYDDDFNSRNDNICTLGIQNIKLIKVHQAGNSIVFLNYLSTILIVFIIAGQLFIDIRKIKSKHSKFYVSFRLSFLLVTFLIILSTSIFSIGFKRYLLNHTQQLQPQLNNNSFNSNITAMILSIIASILIFISFNILYKKFKRTIVYGNERVGYSVLYV